MMNWFWENQLIIFSGLAILFLLNTFYNQKKEGRELSENEIKERTKSLIKKIVDTLRVLLFFLLISIETTTWSHWLINIIMVATLIECFLYIRKKKYPLKKVVLWGIGILVFSHLSILLIFRIPLSSINRQNYYFERLDVAQLWEHSTGYAQTIAIIDSGITDEAMELFQYNIISVYNSIDGSRDVLDENEYAHGTQMASIIIGHGEAGVYGIAPSAQVIIIKAFEGFYSRTDGESLARAVDYAIFQEVDIINMSFGSFQVNNELEEAIERAIEAGIIVVAATGDYGNRDSLFPARMEGVVSVRAKDYNGDFWIDSNLGEGDIMSMYGVDILGLTFGNESIDVSGTSQATALAAGYIALIRDYHIRNDVSLSNEDIFDMLQYLDSNERQDVDYLSPFRFSFE